MPFIISFLIYFELLNTSLKIYKDIIDDVFVPEPKDWKTYENPSVFADII